MTTVSKDTLCIGCGKFVDNDCCHCGSGRRAHDYDETHGFVPHGCECGFVWATRRNTHVLGAAADGGLLAESKSPHPAEREVVENIVYAAAMRSLEG